MAGRGELVVARRDRRLDDAFDRHLLAHQRDLPLGRARDVDQLLDQVADAGRPGARGSRAGERGSGSCSRAFAGRSPRWRSARAGCAARARAWRGTGPGVARRGAAAASARRATPRAPSARGCRRSCRRSRSRRRRRRSAARRCRASSGTGRHGGAGAGPSRTARARRSWWRGCRGSGRRPPDGRRASSRRPAARRRCGPCTRSTTG